MTRPPPPGPRPPPPPPKASRLSRSCARHARATNVAPKATLAQPQGSNFIYLVLEVPRTCDFITLMVSEPASVVLDHLRYHLGVSFAALKHVWSTEPIYLTPRCRACPPSGRYWASGFVVWLSSTAERKQGTCSRAMV
jgi:hypothetical protein